MTVVHITGPDAKKLADQFYMLLTNSGKVVRRYDRDGIGIEEVPDQPVYVNVVLIVREGR